MGSPYADLKSSIELELSKAIMAQGYKSADLANTIAISGAHGDVSCSVSFRISKEAKMSPQDAASGIVSRMGRIKHVSSVTADNGFINFHLDRQSFSKEMVEYIRRGSQDSAPAMKRKKIIIEYVSVNPVDPWHVGKLRNALLGDVISNLYEACGYQVERENYMDNLGLQASEGVWGLMNQQRIGISTEPNAKFDHFIGRVYVAVNTLMESRPETVEEVKKTLALMEQDGTYESKLSREMAEGFLNAERQTAFSYGIYQNVVIWESDIMRERLLDKMLATLERKGLAKRPNEGKYKGCVVVELADLSDTPKELTGLREEAKVLIRSDGTANYIAKDIAFHMWKLGMIENTFKFSKFIERQPNGEPLYTTSRTGTQIDFGNADAAITVTGSEQKFEQLLVKAVISAIDKQKGALIKHVSYGLVELEGKKLAGRKGTWIGYTADDLLAEGGKRAIAAMKENNELTKEEKETIARKVALAAIKFEYLKLSPDKAINFLWDRALNFEGDSGPYCQYTYARASRIIEKSGIKTIDEIKDTGVFDNDAVFGLVKLMSARGEITEKARREDRPNVITDYLSGLAAAFSSFYETVPVLKEESESRKMSLLVLVDAFRNTMKGTLALLGIDAIERM
ncbi:MAG: arginine--tRNA ligase [Candidatus Marsarchaeota archaeon]|jgi:arginyl-tRNA synthetase|nr:arginine--tRNA ligase [Candidatus Marsarchaeota archaeon]MCL5111817.1 arginine--tRNA ligase [Candidatus Marsarchaeota archaeon]